MTKFYFFYCIVGILIGISSVLLWEKGITLFNKNYADSVCIRALERTGYYNTNSLESLSICKEYSEILVWHLYD